MINRRRFISSLGLITALSPRLSLASPLKDKSVSLDLSFLKNAPYNPQEIGQQYLKSLSSPLQLHQLEQSLSNLTEKENMSLSYQEMCHTDFINEDVLTVNGWVVSETEARCCAYHTLSGGYRAA